MTELFTSHLQNTLDNKSDSILNRVPTEKYFKT